MGVAEGVRTVLRAPERVTRLEVTCPPLLGAGVRPTAVERPGGGGTLIGAAAPMALLAAPGEGVANEVAAPERGRAAGVRAPFRLGTD